MIYNLSMSLDNLDLDKIHRKNEVLLNEIFQLIDEDNTIASSFFEEILEIKNDDNIRLDDKVKIITDLYKDYKENNK